MTEPGTMPVTLFLAPSGLRRFPPSPVKSRTVGLMPSGALPSSSLARTVYVSEVLWWPLSSKAMVGLTSIPSSRTVITLRSDVTCLWSLMWSAPRPNTGIAAEGIKEISLSPSFSTVTCIISALTFPTGAKINTEAFRPSQMRLVVFCQRKPASSSASSPPPSWESEKPSADLNPTPSM